jgi:outer membrane protein TolC
MREVEDALAQEQGQLEYLVSLDRQIELAGQMVNRSRQRYINGATDYLPVLEALRSLQKLERTGLEGRLKLIEYRIALYSSLGGSWELTRSSEENETGEARSGDTK